MIVTRRLQLIPCTVQHYEAVLRGNKILSRLLGVRVRNGWTASPEAVLVSYDRLKNDPSLFGWFFYMIIHKKNKELIGTGGFKGKPDHEGTVEIGYEIRPDYREQGYATETAAALIRFAFSQPAVQKVVAHTLEEYNPSVKVLQNNQLKFAGAFPDQEDGKLWRWELKREDYNEAPRNTREA